MAEKLVRSGSPKPLPRQKTKEEKQLDTNSTEKGESSKPPSLVPPDCPVCLQPSIHPVKVPCGHIFCFLCVKGAAHQSQRCALCRQAIPPSFFDSPTLLNDSDLSHGSTSITCEKYAWFYEGRNGWWQYDVRTNHEIEEGYRSKTRSFELLIAGYMYIIDLDNMLQIRRSDPTRRRRIKRDLGTAPKKGIAGLKIAKDNEDEEANIEPEENEEESDHTKDNPGTSSSFQAAGTSERSHQNNNSSQLDHLSSSSPDSSPDMPEDRLSDGLQSLSLSYGQGSVQQDVQDSVNPPEEDESEEVLEI